VKSYQRVACVWLVLVLGVSWAVVGCRKVVDPGPSTTSPPPPAVTTEPGSQPGLPEIPGEEIVVPESPAIVEPDPGEEVALTPAVDLGKLVPLDVELPAPAFRGTPVPLKEPNVEKPRDKPREPFLAPEGTVNVSRGRPVSCSDPAPAGGELDFITDGDKEATDFGYLLLRPGTEWVQVDLGQKATIYAVFLWHNHAEARVYYDVIAQVSDDPDFIDAVTVFNADYDNSSGLGIGTDMGYVETAEGKLIGCRGVEGRYVRLYSRGNHIDENNHYTEVEVYGRPLE